jgi:hypothetical protein
MGTPGQNGGGAPGREGCRGGGRGPRDAGAAREHFGGPLGFRGFGYAPVNELGVVCLFGALAAELGFVIERVRGAYPDCEAKREVEVPGLAWGERRLVRCRIEFEYRSSNFQRHGHDPSGVDLIVCWDHDWFDCPVDVLELSATVRYLQEAERGKKDPQVKLPGWRGRRAA